MYMDCSVARAVPGAPLQSKRKVMSKPMTEVGSPDGCFSITLVALLSQLAPTTTFAFETQNPEETQMLQRELHQERRASTKAS